MDAQADHLFEVFLSVQMGVYSVLLKKMWRWGSCYWRRVEAYSRRITRQAFVMHFLNQLSKKNDSLNICWTKSSLRSTFCGTSRLEDHWSCSSPERLSHCKLMRFKLIENRPMKVYAWTLLTPGAWPNLTQGHDWHNL